MINTKYLLCISTCLLVSSSIQASDINLTYDSSGFLPGSLSLYTLHTPSELRPTPSFNLDNAVKLAAVCSVGGGGCNGLSFGSSDNSMDLDRSAQCEDEGFVNSCSSGYVPDTTQKCPHSNSYFKCRPCINNCDFGYSLTSCSNTQVQTAAYKNECSNTCYRCRSKTCEDVGYAASVTSCQTGTTVSFANKTCYKDVEWKDCDYGAYKSSIPTNMICDEVNYCGQTCYENCYQPTCSDGGYYSYVSANNVCTPVTYYGRTCYKDCYQPTCENGGYKSSIPTNNKCTIVRYYGRSCKKDCYQPTCENGGHLDVCPDGQTGTVIHYYGRKCFFKDSCKNNETEVTCQIGSVLYEDKKCYNIVPENKTPIAVVFDPDKKLAVALIDSGTDLEWGGYGTDIPTLANCSNTSSCSIDGKANTAAIIAYGKTNGISYAAAEYCNRYVTAGTKAGDWHLPSMYELNKIYSAKSTINATISKIGRGTSLNNQVYWSSTEYDYNHFSWILGMTNGGYNFSSKGSRHSVRPVLAY